MRHALELELPVEAPYRALAAEVASRFVELAGADPEAAAGFGADVAATVDALAPAASMLTLTFTAEAGSAEAVVGAAGQSRVVRRQWPPRKD
jgi:hypothetical protein